jgi:hypothetical protein
LGKQTLFAKPDRVIAAIRRIRKIHQPNRAVARDQRRERIAQILDEKADKIPARHPSTPVLPGQSAAFSHRLALPLQAFSRVFAPIAAPPKGV